MNHYYEVIQNVQPIYSLGGYTTPNKDWSYTDKEGHTHKWANDESLPTLDYHPEETEEQWSEFWDEPMDVPIKDAYYTCKQCGEVVKPGRTHHMGPIYQNFGTRYLLDHQEVSHEEFQKSLKEVTDAG